MNKTHKCNWQFFPPAHHLRKYIYAYHFAEGNLPLRISRWVRYLININYGNTFSVLSYDTHEKFTNIGMNFTGISTSPKYFDNSIDWYQYVSVELNPACVAQILGENMVHVTEKSIDLDSFPNIKSLYYLVDSLAMANNLPEKIRMLDNAFSAYFSSVMIDFNPLLAEILDIIGKRRGVLSLMDLIRETGRSKRTIQRIVTEMTGVSPDFLRRTARSEAVIGRLLTEDIADIQDIVYEYGYFDQAHLIKDVKNASHFTPGQLRDFRHFPNFEYMKFLKIMSGSLFFNERPAPVIRHSIIA